MPAGLVTIAYREGGTAPVDYRAPDLDAIKAAFLSHLETGVPAFVELGSMDARSTRTVIVRLSTVRAMEFGRLPG